MKHLFIVNPAAGKGRALDLIPVIKKIFESRDDEYVIEVTKYAGDATVIARNYTSREDCRVYSVGGDGTLNEVLNGVVGSNSVLADIPSGSGNDFIKSLVQDLPKGISNEEILARSIDGRVENIDVGQVNGRHFINISSVGFDGEVVYHARLFKKVPLVSGSLAYIMGVVTTLVKNRSYPLEVTVDGTKVEMDALLLAAGNGKYYGGGMLPLPEAKLNDGLLDACLVERLSRSRIIKFFARFVKGRHMGIKEAHFYRCTQLSISCGTDIVLNIDGELEKVRKADFIIKPGGVKMVIPEMVE